MRHIGHVREASPITLVVVEPMTEPVQAEPGDILIVHPRGHINLVRRVVEHASPF